MSAAAIPLRLSYAPLRATPSSALVIQNRRSTGSSAATFVIDEIGDDLVVGAADLAGGIDYDRWVGLVNPAPRHAFADRLDLLAELDDD